MRKVGALLTGGPLDGKRVAVPLLNPTGPQSVIEVMEHTAGPLSLEPPRNDAPVPIKRHRYMLTSWSGDRADYKHQPIY